MKVPTGIGASGTHTSTELIFSGRYRSLRAGARVYRNKPDTTENGRRLRLRSTTIPDKKAVCKLLQREFDSLEHTGGIDLRVGKAHAAVNRRPGEANPFDVGSDGVSRYFSVVQDCAAAAKLRTAAK